MNTRRGFMGILTATLTALTRGFKSSQANDIGDEKTHPRLKCPPSTFPVLRLDGYGNAINLEEVLKDSAWEPMESILINEMYQSSCKKMGYPIIRFEQRFGWVHISPYNPSWKKNPWSGQSLLLFGDVYISERRSLEDKDHMTAEQITAYDDIEQLCGSKDEDGVNFRVVDTVRAQIVPCA